MSDTWNAFQKTTRQTDLLSYSQLGYVASVKAALTSAAVLRSTLAERSSVRVEEKRLSPSHVLR